MARGPTQKPACPPGRAGTQTGLANTEDSRPVVQGGPTGPICAFPTCCVSSCACPSPRAGVAVLALFRGASSLAQWQSQGSPRPRVGAGGARAGLYPALSPRRQGAVSPASSPHPRADVVACSCLAPGPARPCHTGGRRVLVHYLLDLAAQDPSFLHVGLGHMVGDGRLLQGRPSTCHVGHWVMGHQSRLPAERGLSPG